MLHIIQSHRSFLTPLITRLMSTACCLIKNHRSNSPSDYSEWPHFLILNVIFNSRLNIEQNQQIHHSYVLKNLKSNAMWRLGQQERRLRKAAWAQSRTSYQRLRATLPRSSERRLLGILTEAFCNVSLPKSLVTSYRSLW